MELVGVGQELDAGLLRHPLIGDQQSDRLVARSEVAQLLEAGGGPVRGDDPGVAPEAPVEVALERGQDGGVGRRRGR